MTNTLLKNFFTSLTNASVYKKQEISVSFSLSHIKFLKSLKSNGFIRGFSIKKKEKKVIIFLKYDHFLNSSVNSLKFISKVKTLRPLSKSNINLIFRDFNANCLNNKKNNLSCIDLKKKSFKEISQCLVLLK